MRNAQHLSNVKIQNFRGISKIYLDEFGSFNVLLGANNIGKTSILEAIFLLTGFGSPDLSVRLQNRRKYLVRGFSDLAYLHHRLNIDAPIELSSENVNSMNRRTIILTALHAEQNAINTAQKAGKLHGEYMQSFLPSYSIASISRAPRALKCDWKITNGSSEPISYSGILTVHPDGALHVDPKPDENIAKSIASNSILTWFPEPGTSYNTEAVGNVIINKKKGDLLDVLNRIDPTIEDISIDEDTIYLDIGLERMLPLNMFGSGLVRSIEIISHCISGNFMVLLIDEVENGLHHESIGPFLESLLVLSQERNLQIFATTHSIDILEKFRDVLDNEKFNRELAACYTLAKDKQGTVRSYRYDYSQFDHCIKAGIEIR